MFTNYIYLNITSCFMKQNVIFSIAMLFSQHFPETEDVIYLTQFACFTQIIIKVSKKTA